MKTKGRSRDNSNHKVTKSVSWSIILQMDQRRYCGITYKQATMSARALHSAKSP